MSNDESSNGRENSKVPFRMELPLTPQLDATPDDARLVRHFRTTTWSCQPTNLQAASLQREMISLDFRERYQAGDEDAVEELLQISPSFAKDSWVREALAAQADEGTRRRRRSGRPRGRPEDSVTLGIRVVCIVEHLVAVHDWSPEKAIQELAKRHFEGLDYDAIKRHYYRSRRDSRLSPLLFVGDFLKLPAQRQP